MNISLLSGAFEAVSSWAKSREHRKEAVSTAKMKVQQARDDAENSLDLTDAEWESIKARSENGNWKGVTVLITLPGQTHETSMKFKEIY